jgi:hypothetical protein
MAMVFVFLYLPIVALVVFSFNDSPVPNLWRGFTLKWYAALAADDEMISAFMLSMKEAFFTDVLPRETLAIPEANAIACEHDDFLSALREGRQPLVPATAGAAALEIANRVVDSLRITTLGGSQVPATVPLPSRLRRTG